MDIERFRIIYSTSIALLNPNTHIGRTRLAGAITTAIFLILYFQVPMMLIQDIKEQKCTPPRSEENTPNWRPDSLQLLYSHLGCFLYEYPMEGDMYLDPKVNIDIIPVILVNGHKEKSTSYSRLVSIVNEKTRQSAFRFNFFSVDFKGSHPLASSLVLRQETDFLKSVSAKIALRYPSKKQVVIANGVEGSLSIGPFFESIIKGRSPGADLHILEATKFNTPTIDEFVDKIENQRNTLWRREDESSTTGVVHFSSGWDHSNDKVTLQNVISIPTWTIDGLPDEGIDEREMPRCAPFSQHVSDLLMAYGKRHKQETGKSIVKSFYSEFKKNKTEQLPSGWKKDKLENALTIRTGNNYMFSINSLQWIIVDLKRSESIWLKITGKCLKAATVIRQKKYIRRHESAIDNTVIELGIFKGIQYEDVRILVESDGVCDLSIETSSSWLVYMDRFRGQFDGHYFFIGAMVTSTFLFILESEKRSVRVEHQLLCYVLSIVGFLFISLDGHMLFSYVRTKLLLGFGAAFSTHFIFSFASEVAANGFRKNLDARFVSVKKVRQRWHRIILVFVLGACLGSHTLSFLLLHLLVITSNRVFLVIPMLLPAISLYMRVITSQVIRMDSKREADEDSPDLLTLKHRLLHFLMFMEAVPVVLDFLNFNQRNNRLQTLCSLREYQFRRDVFTYICVIVLVLQLAFAHSPLEMHLAVTIIILYSSMYIRSYIPKAYNENVVNSTHLEGQYEFLESEDY